MSLQNEMERIGRITAADQGLEVRIRGVQAYAVPGTITIPNIETFDWLGANAYRMLHGLLDHEAGHAADSDFEATRAFRMTHPPEGLDRLFGAVEDGYVERLRGRRYRGCGHNIKLMNEWFYSENVRGKTVIERIAEGKDRWVCFVMAVGMVVTPYGHRDIGFFKGLNDDIYQMLRAVEKELTELQGIVESKATARNIELCRRIFDRFNENSPENSKGDGTESDGDAGDESEESGDAPEENGDNEADGDADGDAEGGAGAGADDDESGDESEGEATAGDAGDEKGEQGDESEAEAGKGESDESGESGDSSADGDGESENDGDGEGDKETPVDAGDYVMDLDRWTKMDDAPLNATDQINMKVGEVFDYDGPTQPYTVFSHEFDAFRDFASEDQAAVAKQYEKEMEEVRSAADSLISCFEAALRAMQMARPVGGADEGDIDGDVLGEYGVGALPADQLYLQYAETDSDNVAVAILCDCSGSMRGKKADLCRKTAMAMSHALQQVHIAHEISGFTTMESYNVSQHPWADGKRREYTDNFDAMRRALTEAQVRGTKIENFARDAWGDCHNPHRMTMMVPFHVRFKSFESDDARSLARIVGIDQNLDGEAVIWQARRLAERHERRKVLFVLSDGCPAGSHDNAQGARYLSESIARVIESGIEVYGIGITDSNVQRFYPEWWVCNDLNDLTTIAMEGLGEVLTRNRTENERVHLDR